MNGHEVSASQTLSTREGCAFATTEDRRGEADHPLSQTLPSTPRRSELHQEQTTARGMRPPGRHQTSARNGTTHTEDCTNKQKRSNFFYV